MFISGTLGTVIGDFCSHNMGLDDAGPHQEAMAISLSDLDCSLQMTRRAMKRAPVTAVLTGRPSMLRPEMKSPTAVPAALIKTTVSQ